MANNITIKSSEIVGINRICPYAGDLKLISKRWRNPTKSEVMNVMTPVVTNKITHEAHFAGPSMRKAKECISTRNIKVGVMVWFGAASAVQRPSHSRALYVDDELYYILSWTDILGKGHGRENNPCRIRNKLLINYLQIIDTEEHKQLILDEITALKLM